MTRQASTCPTDDPAISTPTRIPRSEHCISRKDISSAALKVLYTLNKAGHEAYLVGGCVRDLLLGHHPKDFDVATSALPEEVRECFDRCRLIGRRFRLAHVRMGREIIEVATFRASAADAHDHPDRLSVDGRIVRDNVYGALEEDAWRRDFTINCLYYDVRDFTVVDFAGGMQDLAERKIRLIGDPDTRYREDPVRALRAIRFAAKLGLEIEPGTAALIPEFAAHLEEMPPARLFDEVMKIFLGGAAEASYEMLQRYGCFEPLFPESVPLADEDPDGPPQRLLRATLENTDARVAEGKPVTPAFILAALLWPAVSREAARLREQGERALPAMESAGYEVLSRQVRRVTGPRRFGFVAREIWAMQPRLERQRGGRGRQLLAWERFRAAYDFLELRAKSGEEVEQSVAHWTRMQSGADTADAPPDRERRRPRRRSSRRRRAPPQVAT